MSRGASMISMTVVALATLARPVGAAEPEPAGERAAEDEPRAQSQPRRASLEIDTSDIGAEGPVVKRRVRERADVALRAAGVLPARPDHADPLVHVDIDALQGEDPGYQFELWVSQGGTIVGERRRVECTLCTESEIVARVEATITEVLGQLEVPRDEAVAAEPKPPAPEPSEPETEPDRPRARLSGLGRAGIGLLSVGVVGVGVGAVLVALPPTVDENDPLYETTTRPPGFAVLGVGAAVLVSGVVMLAVDRKRTRARTTAIVPTLGPRLAAVTWRVRF